MKIDTTDLSNEFGFCHSERSEESLEASRQEIFRFAQDDRN